MTTSILTFIMWKKTSLSNFNHSMRCDMNIKSRSTNNLILSRNLKEMIMLNLIDILTISIERIVRFIDVSRLTTINFVVIFWQLSMIKRFLIIFNDICSNSKMSLSNNILIFKSSTIWTCLIKLTTTKMSSTTIFDIRKSTNKYSMILRLTSLMSRILMIEFFFSHAFDNLTFFQLKKHDLSSKRHNQNLNKFEDIFSNRQWRLRL